MTIGTTMAYLLYMKKIVDNFGEMSNNLQSIARVQGASYKVAELIVKQPKVVMNPNGKSEVSEMGTIDIDHVKFSYPTKKDVTVLKDVTINVRSN